MKETPNYFAIIPADIRYNKKIKDKAKLLYGEITALSDKNGYCYASNKYFADLYEISITTVSLLIKNLVENGYIENEIIYKKNSKEIDKRYLKIVKGGYLKNLKGGIKEKLKDNNTSINNTSINNNNMSSKVEEIINYLNQPGTDEPIRSFKKNTQSTKSKISARLKEGFTIDDLKDVIYFKYNQWVKKPIMFKNGVMSDTYYRPDTLFSSKNFENYLQEYKEKTK